MTIYLYFTSTEEAERGLHRLQISNWSNRCDFSEGDIQGQDTVKAESGKDMDFGDRDFLVKISGAMYQVVRDRKPTLASVAQQMQEMITLLNDHEGAEGWSAGMSGEIDRLLEIKLENIS